MDTIRAKRVIARLFAILTKRGAQRASRFEQTLLVVALPTRPESAAPGAFSRALSPEALRDVYRLLQRRRHGESLDEMIALYRRQLLRRGWSETTADARAVDVRRFMAEALGVSDGADAAMPTTVHQKEHRLRHAFDRRKVRGLP